MEEEFSWREIFSLRVFLRMNFPGGDFSFYAKNLTQWTRSWRNAVDAGSCCAQFCCLIWSCFVSQLSKVTFLCFYFLSAIQQCHCPSNVLPLRAMFCITVEMPVEELYNFFSHNFYFFKCKTLWCFIIGGTSLPLKCV